MSDEDEWRRVTADIVSTGRGYLDVSPEGVRRVDPKVVEAQRLVNELIERQGIADGFAIPQRFHAGRPVDYPGNDDVRKGDQ